MNSRIDAQNSRVVFMRVKCLEQNYCALQELTIGDLPYFLRLALKWLNTQKATDRYTLSVCIVGLFTEKYI